MPNIMKSFIFIVLLLFPMVGFSALTWSGYYPVANVYTHSSGNVYVRLDPATSHTNVDGCISTYWLIVPSAQNNKKELLQLLLTAQAAGLKVQIALDGCQSSYPILLNAMTTS